MTESGVIDLPFPDAKARTRIVEDLDTNLLVEAGAGSGKTTELVKRMTALITSGRAQIEEIAAVTFTRKAAGELRQRFQMALEDELRAQRTATEPDEVVGERLGSALENIDRAFVGTIHSFCARLLRERPLEIGLDPGFEELPVEERIGLRNRFWESYLERLTRESDPILEELATAGLRPGLLTQAFEYLVENPDVDFPAEDTEPPSVAELGPIRTELEDVVDLAWELMPEREPPNKWDSLQKRLRALHFTRDVTGWKEPSDLFEALATLWRPGPKGHQLTQNRWKDRALAKALGERVKASFVGDTPAGRALRAWYAHRYALAIRLCRHAAKEYEAHRLRIGRLDFQDLLVLAARLLRTDPDVRRQLGLRYRYLLVDEFQDTDPLQAEIVLLLASEPVADAAASGDDASADADQGEAPADWRSEVPRPGALFVVGDPKQSIYRFRRADIQLYSMVKERFAEFGAVVELTMNFRSRPCIGDLVNEHFRGPDFFPEEATAAQARFEPLNTRPPTESVVGEGVFYYEIDPDARRKVAAFDDDAARLASWIRDRIDRGERRPGDFMILTRMKAPLSAYARALEARSVPIQVTGAGVGVEEEITELEVVVECMIDPTNPVKVVAALVGLFFGLDYEALLSHRLEGGGFDVMRPRDRGHPEVLEALRTLHGWWRTATNEPADIFLSRLVSDLGLRPYAAAGELGTLRAGALVYAMDAVRAATLGGDASLPGALAALRSALAIPEAEAPLEPNRNDVVRLMNLHQAKGLEATVVVLADPTGLRERPPNSHCDRRTDGSAVGYLLVTEATSGFGKARVMAMPAGWVEKEVAEVAFGRAEDVRLTYVAVTRACEELVIARWAGGKGASAWATLDPWLDERAERLELEIRDPGPRERLELTADEAGRAARGAAERLAEMAEPTFTHTSVTAIAEGDGAHGPGDRASSERVSDAALRGLSWGSVVHGALAAAAREGVTDDALRGTCRDLLVAQARPLDDHGEPTELLELLELIGAVRGSKLWLRAQAAERHLVEVSFATHHAPEEPGPVAVQQTVDDEPVERRQLDLFAAGPSGGPPGADDDSPGSKRQPDRATTAGDVVRVIEGVIDLAFREPDGWVIADYKTDIGTDPDFAARSVAYRRQVDLYAEAWATLTGERVKERVLFYTAQGRVESW